MTPNTLEQFRKAASDYLMANGKTKLTMKDIDKIIRGMANRRARRG